LTLYERGLLRKKLSRKIAERARREKMEKGMEGATFKPSINLYTRNKSARTQFKTQAKKIRNDLLRDWRKLDPFSPAINKK